MVFCNSNNEQHSLVFSASHNPYFNRWFSAINTYNLTRKALAGHNPYFNRWFSAIIYIVTYRLNIGKSQSLF